MNRTFFWKYDDEYGFAGWIPLWMPEFNAQGGMPVHDLFDHPTCERRPNESELMALGCALWMRGESGWLYEKAWWRPVTLEEWTAEGMSDIMSAVSWSVDLGEPPKGGPLESEVEGNLDFDLVMRHAIKLWMSNNDVGPVNDEDELPLGDPDADSAGYQRLMRSRGNMIGWMRHGYRHAKRIYRAAEPYSLSRLYDQLMKVELPKLDDEAQAKLVVDIDMHGLKGDVKIVELQPDYDARLEDEDDEYPERWQVTFKQTVEA